MAEPGPAGQRPAGQSLFLHRVRDFVRGPAVTTATATPATDVARLMSDRGVGAVVVVDAAAAPVGIVTDRDLRRKIVAPARDPVTATAAEIMSTPVVTTRAGAFAFEALLEMTRREIHHLPVVEDGRLAGVVASDDLLFAQAVHPVSLTQEIARAPSVEALRDAASRVVGLVTRLREDGGTPYQIGQLVTELNDRMVVRALGLTAEALERDGEPVPVVPFCWLAFGSEGRREQTLRTDQDNGLVYADLPEAREAGAAAYFARFATRAIQVLVDVGFPPCPGDIMSSNPKWCQPVSVWLRHFGGWMEETTPEHVLAASIFFDLRPLAGARELGVQLVEMVRQRAPAQALFLRRLAEDVVQTPLPLTRIRGRVVVEHGGPHEGTVDLKSGGTRQVVGAARLHALALGIAETNTVDRLAEAARRGAYPAGEARDLIEAYQHLLGLRLGHQLTQLARGETPDNHVRLDDLSRADAVLLRDALSIVARLQTSLRDRYVTDLLG